MFSRSTFGPLLLVLVMLLLFLLHRPPARPHLAPPWAVGSPFSAAPEAADIPLPNLGLSLDEFVQQSDLQIASSEGLYSPDDREHLATELDWALAYTSNRFGSGPRASIITEIQQNDGCELHGAAFTDERRVQVSTCAQIPRNRVVNMLAHEFVHQLAHDYYGPAHLQADMILLEGLATWGAGDYWLSGQPTFRAFVRQHIPPEQRLPLNTSYAGRSLNDMNTLYYEWASFVEFLLQNYGRAPFDALYVTGNAQQPGSANYPGIYGKDLAALEQEWLAWLEQA